MSDIDAAQRKAFSPAQLPNMKADTGWASTNGDKGITVMRRVRRRGDGSTSSLAQWILQNQTGISFTLISLLVLSHRLWPQAKTCTTKFLTLSYHNPGTGKYAIGYDDFYFMAFFFVLFTGLRSACIHHLLEPLARCLGLSGRKEVTRFAEQSYMLLYYSCFWPMGMHIYRSSPYWLNLKELWTGWPDRELQGIVKAYYLMQWSFWAQQVVVLNIEQRRKDHWQMLTHHFVTIALIACSYAYHYTRVGNLILVIMDFVDLIFPMAKLAKYLGYQKVCDALFGLFVVSWLVTRHVFYMMVCWSIYSDAPAIMPHACFAGGAQRMRGPLPLPEGWSWALEPFRDPRGLLCFDNRIVYVFLTYLLSLQAMMVVWSFYIVKVVVRVLNGYAVDDVRSDDEEEVDDLHDTAPNARKEGGKGDEEEYEEALVIEQEVGVEDIDFQAWERRTGVKRALSSGVSLPGHSDRKELLNRIGCEKQID